MAARSVEVDKYLAAHPGMKRDTARNILRKAAYGEMADEAEAKRVRRLELEVKELRSAKDRLRALLDDAEDLRDSVFGLMVTDMGPPRWPVLKEKKADRLHKPILFTSDFQFGEVVNAAEMDGMNSYNRTIFAERYANMIDKTIRWGAVAADSWGATYDEGMIYLRGGDAISGEIHDELRETNDASCRGALLELAGYECEGIRRLRDRFGHVHVISIAGNHGRVTIKPRHKRYTELNFETILADLIQAKFEREPGITFDTPISGFARFEACGWWFEMAHGDRGFAGGGAGWIGAPAPITKGHKKMRLQAAEVGAPVNFTLSGHFHTSMKLPGAYANGTLVGYNEYARGLGLQPDAAKQWLLLPSRRHVWDVELQLSDLPRRR